MISCSFSATRRFALSLVLSFLCALLPRVYGGESFSGYNLGPKSKERLRVCAEEFMRRYGDDPIVRQYVSAGGLIHRSKVRELKPVLMTSKINTTDFALCSHQNCGQWSLAHIAEAGSKKRHCLECGGGRQQIDRVEVLYDPEGGFLHIGQINFLTQEEVDHLYARPDWVCPTCPGGTLNPMEVKACTVCGTPKPIKAHHHEHGPLGPAYFLRDDPSMGGIYPDAGRGGSGGGSGGSGSGNGSSGGRWPSWDRAPRNLRHLKALFEEVDPSGKIRWGMAIVGGVVVVYTGAKTIAWLREDLTMKGEVVETRWQKSAQKEVWSKTTKRDWRHNLTPASMIPPRQGSGGYGGVLDIRNCSNEVYDYEVTYEQVWEDDPEPISDTDWSFGDSSSSSDSYFSPSSGGSYGSDSSYGGGSSYSNGNGTTTWDLGGFKSREFEKIFRRAESLIEEAIKSKHRLNESLQAWRTVEHRTPIYREKCDYDTYEWISVGDPVVVSGKNPSSALSSLPSPSMNLGSFDRASYSVQFEIDLRYPWGRREVTDTYSEIKSEAEFLRYGPGSSVTVKRRRLSFGPREVQLIDRSGTENRESF